MSRHDDHNEGFRNEGDSSIQSRLLYMQRARYDRQHHPFSPCTDSEDSTDKRSFNLDNSPSRTLESNTQKNKSTQNKRITEQIRGHKKRSTLELNRLKFLENQYIQDTRAFNDRAASFIEMTDIDQLIEEEGEENKDELQEHEPPMKNTYLNESNNEQGTSAEKHHSVPGLVAQAHSSNLSKYQQELDDYLQEMEKEQLNLESLINHLEISDDLAS